MLAHLNPTPRTKAPHRGAPGLTSAARRLAAQLGQEDLSRLPQDVPDALEELTRWGAKHAEEAAFLLAALMDPTAKVNLASLSQETKGAAAELLMQLKPTGLMDPYALSQGRFGIWGEPTVPKP